MTSGDAIATVIVASAQSVAKVFVIGGVGGLAVLLPRKAPFLPCHLVGSVARFTFHTLTLPLIYVTIAIAVSIETVGNYWFLIVGGWGVLATSYAVATALQCCIPIHNQNDYQALRVAATFPNIVALPILIFPSLCEFQVVHEGYASDYVNAAGAAEDTLAGGDDGIDLQRECIAQSTTMIFCYFFAWSLAFWSFGNPQLMRAAAARNRCASEGHSEDVGVGTGTGVATPRTPAITPSPSTDDDEEDEPECPVNSVNGKESRNGSIVQEFASSAETTMMSRTDRQQSLVMLELGEGDETHTELRGQNEPPLVESTAQQSPSPHISEKETHQETPEQSMDVALSPPSLTNAENAPLEASNDSNDKGCWAATQSVLLGIWVAVKQTCTSPGFIAMLLGFITACIPPLQRAMFEPGGPLRFFGSSMETLGSASSPLSTMVVAASLVPPRPQQQQEEEDGNENQVDEEGDNGDNAETNNGNARRRRRSMVIDEQPGMTDPNFGPYQRPTARHGRGQQSRGRRHSSSSRFLELRRSMRSSSLRLLQAVPRSTPEMRRLYVWFILSRLVVTPAVVVGLILALDCSGGAILDNVPNLAKLVIIVNSALPGALIVVVLLKSKEEMADTAAAVSKVYLPSYLISILTIAAWTAIGLYITIPDEDGNTFCQQ